MSDSHWDYPDHYLIEFYTTSNRPPESVNGVTQPPAPPRPPTPTPKLTILSTSHIPQYNVSLVYQGPPKSGKTWCALTWPSPLVFYFDKNLGELREHPGIPYVQPANWTEWERDWLPAIRNRRLTELVQNFQDAGGAKPYSQYKVRTIVLDSWTNFANMNKLELGGENGEKSLGHDGWGAYGGRLNRTLADCTSACSPDPKHPERETYHFISTVHESETTDSDGRIESIDPSIQGQMRKHFVSFVDCVLLTDYVDEKKQVNEKSPPTVTRRHFVHAKDATRYRKASVSGEFKKLPAQVAGDYSTINKYLQLEKS